MLTYGPTWVNAMDCRFEDNQVGFRFNAEGTVVTHTQYANNEFFHNGTAVLLKSVPAESPLSFPGSVFEDNDTDIANRCGREVNISQTTYRFHVLELSSHPIWMGPLLRYCNRLCILPLFSLPIRSSVIISSHSASAWLSPL